MNLKKLALWVSVALLGGLTNPTSAQTYPNRPIRLIVPYPAGGGTDILARSVFQKVSESLGQPFVVENKGGAGTSIGLAEVARSHPDGYTIGIGGTSDPLLPILYDNLPFNPMTDLIFVSTLASVPIVLVAGPSVPAKTMQEFLAYAKGKNTAPLSYASMGVATPHHMAGILLAATLGIPLTHIPYKGTAPALTDLVGGHVPLATIGLPSALPYAREGKLKILGVASAKRSALAPEIPTIEEGGLKDFVASYWWHVIAPKGTPKPIVDRLNDEIGKALRLPELRDSLLKGGFEPLVLTRDEADRALKEDTARWTKVIRENNIRGQ